MGGKQFEQRLEQLKAEREQLNMRLAEMNFLISGYETAMKRKKRRKKMTDWFNWTNFFYLLGLILAGGATFVGLKYKKLIDEIKEVFNALQEAYEDGKLSKAEQKAVMKEILDVFSALLKIAWK